MRKFKLSDQVMEKLGYQSGSGKKKRGPEQLKMQLISDRTEKKPDTAADGQLPRESVESGRDAERVPTVVARTETGRIRKTNQDSLINAEGLMGVADGMGGQRGGEVASAGARDELLKAVSGRPADEKTLREAIEQANKVLFEMQARHTELQGMGTTLTVLWPADGSMLIGHVGDSRAYLLRDGRLEQMTEDHSMVAEMQRAGFLSDEQARRHPMRNIITRAVGTEENVRPDIKKVDRKKGDRWLVCSDGLYGMIGESDLQRLLKQADAQEAADGLVEAAMQNGGADNISLILFDDGEADA